MESDLQAHAETLDALAAWDGTRQQAHELRGRVQALNPIAAKAPDLANRALRKAISCYQGDQAPSNLLRFLEKQDESARVLLAPLLGDPEMEGAGQWLHSAGYQRCGEREGREYLALLAQTSCVVDDELEQFALTFLRVRRRATWMVAARATARMALRTPSLAQTVSELWRRVFPDGLPKRWKPIGELVPSSLGPDRTHLARHVLYLGCAWLAEGGDPAALPGLDAEALASRKFPSKGFQDSDKSLVLDSLLLFAHISADSEELLANIGRRVGEVGADPQCDRALEAWVEGLEGAELTVPLRTLRATALMRLATPRWKEAEGSTQREGAWSWVRTHQWIRRRDAPALVQQMLEDGSLSTALRVVGGEVVPDLVEKTAAALRVLLTDAVRRTSPPDVLSAAYVDAFAMLHTEALTDMDWPSLLERATGRAEFDPLLRGTVGEVGVVNVAVLLALRGVRVDSVLRDCSALQLDPERAPEVALSLAACEDGAVARQAAVQLERLLRHPPGCEGSRPPEVDAKRAQLKLLWRVLRVDPPRALFTQVALMLRSPLSLSEPDLYASTMLHQLVDAVAHADAVRGIPTELAPALDAVAEIAMKYAEFSGDSDPGLQSIRDLAAQVQNPFEPETFVPVLRNVVGDQSRGLIRWRRWLGHEGSDEGLLDRVEQLGDALAAVLDGLPALDEPSHAALLRAGDELVTATGGLASAERALFDALVDQMRSWATAKLAAGRRALDTQRALTHALDVADEARCRELADAPELLSLLPPADKRRLNRFLQSHLLLAEARKVQATTTVFRSNGEFLRPLYLGAAAGTFFVLDVGDPWLQLADAGDYPRLWATVALGLVGSFALLGWDVGRRMQPPRWQAPPQRLVHPFCFATAAALFASVVVATSAGVIEFGTSLGWQKLALWTSLSLFLGVFLHLIVGSGRVDT